MPAARSMLQSRCGGPFASMRCGPQTAASRFRHEAKIKRCGATISQQSRGSCLISSPCAAEGLQASVPHVSVSLSALAVICCAFNCGAGKSTLSRHRGCLRCINWRCSNEVTQSNRGAEAAIASKLILAVPKQLNSLPKQLGFVLGHQALVHGILCSLSLAPSAARPSAVFAARCRPTLAAAVPADAITVHARPGQDG